MLSLVPNIKGSRPLRVLCIGAHCDDIEIGCGATLRALQSQRKATIIDWALLSGTSQRAAESTKAMSLLVPPRARGELMFGDFADGRFPADYARIKEFFESLKRLPRPDVIFCHERDDRHQDHRVVNEMTWNTFRDHIVLEYEIPKWDGGLGQPNVYVPVTAKQADAKVKALLRAHRSQLGRDWFTAETFMALMRLRGIECRAESGLAEAFHGRKLRVAAI
ncbi:MAG TPA: PIG-L deacetylase family protein [Steroidobacteraceae bacterium]|jgi:LmbE family N-acetylglucosaminyl deacetylase|nr:PIG-L deacetylase family protein [Steroidobacteraceae bacterium]